MINQLPQAWLKVLSQHPQLAQFAAKVGQTPLLKLPHHGKGAQILAKCEWTNPTRTVKDRTALAMLLSALAGSDLASLRQGRILEYSGGSLGASLGALCKALDVPLTLVLSDAVGATLRQTLADLGADVEFVPKSQGFYAVMERAMALAAAHPEWTFLYQHHNSANVQMHAATTGREILEQAGAGPIAAMVAAIGTGGTLAGIYQALSTHFPTVQAYGVTPAELPYASQEQPNGLPKFAGSGGLGRGLRQPFIAAIDSRMAGHFTFTFAECLVAMRDFYDETGIMIGSSAAANLLASRQIAARLPAETRVVTVFPCAGTPRNGQKPVRSSGRSSS